MQIHLRYSNKLLKSLKLQDNVRQKIKKLQRESDLVKPDSDDDR